MTLILSGTNGLSEVDGSAATPAIRGTDANTGIFFPAADTIAFSEGGVEAMRIDSSGNVGIGTSSPSKKLVVSNSGAAGLEIDPFTRSATTGTSLLSYNRSTSAYVRADYDAEQHLFFTSATERMRIDSSGNVGIGVTPPAWYSTWTGAVQSNVGVYAGKLNAYLMSGVYLDASTNYIYTNTGVAPSFLQQNAGGFYWYSAASGTAGNTVTFGTAKMTLDASGNLLVGTTDTTSSSGSGLKFLKSFEGSGNDRTSLVFASSSNTQVPFTMYSTGASTYRFYVGAGGTVYATNTTISSLSDVRYKENIRDLDDGLDVVMALKPRKFDWKEGKGADTKNARGFIAQEFENVFPDLIDEWKDPAPEGEEPYKSVRADLIPVLVKAIQEQQAIITQLQADVAALQAPQGTP